MYGGGDGRPLGAMPSPQTPDCRGGVFAVFAKIPPPIATMRAHHAPMAIPLTATVAVGRLSRRGVPRRDKWCRIVIKTIDSHRCEAYGVAWYAHMGGAFVATWRAASRSPKRPCPTVFIQ